jgi:redox-sensitive bicupin YhaK (pirin superfamily)
MTIAETIPIREVPLIGGMTVRRILPYRTRRSVGPFTFLDEMGPHQTEPGSIGDVPPHPHIGLATVTYLFEGEILHRDSLGSVQKILPGDVNWMTAGKGIVHSERLTLDFRNERGTLHGLQAWVALPMETEDQDPSFAHFDQSELPSFEVSGVRIRLIAGEAFGYASPVKTNSKLFYFSCSFPTEQSFTFDPQGQEAAMYLIEGEVVVDERTFAAPAMIVFHPGSTLHVSSNIHSRAVLFGGQPLEGPRHMYWNFVSSSVEKIEKAKQRWRHQQFPKIEGETEFVPLPE